MSAPGTPATIGTNSAFNIGNTVVVTLSAAVPTGDQVIVGAGSSSAAGGVVSSILDSKGNTYHVDAASVVARNAAIGSAKVTSALSIGDTITVTWTSSVSSRRHAAAVDAPGLDQTTWLDTTNHRNATTSGWDGGATGTLGQADEIVFAVGFFAAPGTSTPKAGFTELYDFGDGSSDVSVVYQIVSATTTVTPGGTWSSAGTAWEAVTASYKGGAAGGGGQTVTMTGLDTASSVGTVTAVPGAVTATMTGLASASSFGTTTALPGVVNVSVNGLASAASFGSPGEATGPVSVPVSGLGSAGAFGTIGGPAAPTEHFDPAIHGGKHR